MKRIGLMIAFISLLFMVGCGGTNGENSEQTTEKTEKMEIFTTIYPLQYFAEQIGGEFVDVTNIIPVGSDAHTYEPTAKTMISVADGDLFIYSGAGIEGFVDAMIQSFDNQELNIIKAIDGVELLESDQPEEEHDDHAGHEHGDLDPHVWLDPLLSIELARNIKEALVLEMPEQEEFFTTNFALLQKELEQIDEEFRAMTEAVSKDTFIVSHAGYGYWEERYGLHQVSITGLSPTNEPSQKQLQSIVQLAKEHDLTHIAFEQNISSKIAETVQREIGADVVYLHNLEALTEENIAEGDDFVRLMRKNIEALRTALQ